MVRVQGSPLCGWECLQSSVAVLADLAFSMPPNQVKARAYQQHGMPQQQGHCLHAGEEATRRGPRTSGVPVNSAQPNFLYKVRCLWRRGKREALGTPHTLAEAFAEQGFLLPSALPYAPLRLTLDSAIA